MNRKGSIITYLIIGIIGSVIFIFLGYFCAGALGIGQSEEIGFIDGLFTVLNSPFAGYFNDYTIVFMILGFILFESLFALFLFSHKKEEEVDADEYKPDIIDLVDIEDEQIKGKKNDLPDDVDLFMSKGVKAVTSSDSSGTRGYVSSSETGSDTKENGSGSDDDNLAPDNLSFGSEIMEEMLGDNYELDQLLAMLSIKKYMKDVTADLLKRMFNPDMTPEEISSYISLFYG